MPIDVFTGQPGNGKTSFMMERLVSEAKKKNPRPLWAGGIDGLAPGLASVLKDPREWNAVKPGETCTCDDTENEEPCTAHVVPNGSLIFIDEAWKWFGHLHDATRQATPLHVLKLAEHRHRGIDFVWTTQMPNQLYPFVRGLIGTHTHVVRRFGTQFVELFRWNELQEDVKSISRRENAVRTTATLPKGNRDKWKSAEEHTIKASIPWRLAVLPLAVVVVIVAGVVVYKRMQPEAVAESALQSGGSPGLPGDRPGAGGALNAQADIMYSSPAAYVAAMKPRVEYLPASAPIYDGRQVQAYPEAYCVVSGPGRDAQGEWRDGGCTCYTQQMTRVAMHPDACRKIALDRGDFDPYREPPREPVRAVAAVGGAGGTPAVDGAQAPAVAVVGIGYPGQDPAPHGTFRSEGSIASLPTAVQPVAQ
jgi:hypothetical protein